MTIEDIVDYTLEHLRVSNYSENELCQVFRSFAQQELNLKDERLDRFVTTAILPDGVELLNIDQREFCTWYYINYLKGHRDRNQALTIIPQPVQWRFDTGHLPIEIYRSVEFRPVRFWQENDLTHYQICSREEASHWAVYLRTVNNRAIWFADCTDESSAFTLYLNLKKLIDFWEVRVMIDIQDASIQKIRATHRLEVLTVDRDVLEDKDANLQTNMCSQQIVSGDVSPGKFHLVNMDGDKSDKTVKDFLTRIGF